MDSLNHSEVIKLLLQLSIMLAMARIFAETARKFKQPAVIGEIIVGIILGPTVFGLAFPDIFTFLFPSEGGSAIVLDGLVQISVVSLLFIAGLEVELNVVWSQGKRALQIALFSIFTPLLAGFAFALTFPEILGLSGDQPLVYALFFGLSISITGLAVIARILMDLELFKTNSGLLMIGSAMIIDVLAWIIFSVILSLKGDSPEGMGVILTIALTLVFTFIMLTVGKAFINKVLPWINKKMAWPGGFLSISLALCFFAGSFTEYIGIHGTFGAFIMGVALGDSEHMPEKAKEILYQFINNIFAPIFFISIGIKLNFIEGFNPLLVLIIVVLGVSTKVIGTFLGSRFTGLNKNDSIIIGFGLNSRGSVDIVLALIALESNLINEEIFIGLVIMALISSIATGPILKFFSKGIS
ncbi:MAG: cation:proton antiporter [Anditalea sp.]